MTTHAFVDYPQKIVLKYKLGDADLKLLNFNYYDGLKGMKIN